MAKWTIGVVIMVLLSVLLFVGCDPPNGDVNEIEVFAAGFYIGDDDIADAFYWEALIDTDGNINSRAVPSPVILDDDVDSYAYGIVRADDTTIVAGSLWDTNDSISIPCIWEDGIRTNLPVYDPENPRSGFTSCVDSGSTYVGGTVVNNDTFYNTACYWKDGILNLLADLPAGTTYSGVTDIQFQADGTLYLTGKCSTLDETFLSVWKIDSGGVEVRSNLSLPSGVTFADVGGMFVNGTDVYVCGFYQSDTTEQTACYWLNGVKTDVGTAEIVRTTGIAASSESVFVAGWTATLDEFFMLENQRAHVWKDGARTDLSTFESGAADIKLFGDDVVVSGFEEDSTSSEDLGVLWLLEGYSAPAAAVLSRNGQDTIEFIKFFLAIFDNSEITSID